MMSNLPTAAKIIRSKLPKWFHPKIAIILGSGLGDLVSHIETPTIISYETLPDFYRSYVPGHAGKLYCGMLANRPVLCLQGRAHLYEGFPPENIATTIQILKLLGCETLIITNAAGSLRLDIFPGSLVSISDHINLQHNNPLIGIHENFFGSRFITMNNAYDATLRHKLLLAAADLKIELIQGIYMGIVGPSFETPAEIRAFQILGADIVGMSTVQEVIAARQCGLKVIAISAITNYAAGLSLEELSHQHTLEMANKINKELTALIVLFIEKFSPF